MKHFAAGGTRRKPIHGGLFSTSMSQTVTLSRIQFNAGLRQQIQLLENGSLASYTQADIEHHLQAFSSQGGTLENCELHESQSELS